MVTQHRHSQKLQVCDQAQRIIIESTSRLVVTLFSVWNPQPELQVMVDNLMPQRAANV